MYYNEKQKPNLVYANKKYYNLTCFKKLIIN